MGFQDTGIQGVTASPGTAQGFARVVVGAGWSTIKEGEIIVCHMTTPSFVPAMKKCRGIITNQGGRLCHAAIVARELGKPCIVATQNATQKLTTGQLIRMEAEPGNCRVLLVT